MQGAYRSCPSRTGGTGVQQTDVQHAGHGDWIGLCQVFMNRRRRKALSVNCYIQFLRSLAVSAPRPETT